MGKRPVTGVFGALWLGLAMTGCDCCHKNTKPSWNSPPPPGGVIGTGTPMTGTTTGRPGYPTVNSGAPGMGYTPGGGMPAGAGVPAAGTAGPSVGWNNAPASGPASGVMQTGAMAPVPVGSTMPATTAQMAHYQQTADEALAGAPARTAPDAMAPVDAGNIHDATAEAGRTTLPPTPPMSSGSPMALPPAGGSHPMVQDMTPPAGPAPAPLPSLSAPPAQPTRGTTSVPATPDAGSAPSPLAEPPPPLPPGVSPGKGGPGN
jgi:hypothetical protein